ncbi:MAG: hypothetical protein ACK4TL_07405 [Hyphomicrobiaceae bacterium]
MPLSPKLHAMPPRALRSTDTFAELSPMWRAGDWRRTPVVAAYIALFAGMTWRWIAGAATIPWDAKAHFHPQVQFLAQSLARGDWPWWNPYVFAGHPQIADPQSMIFSPPFLLLALLNGSPSLWAGDMTVLATMAFGGIGLIIYFHARGWHWAGALMAALAFSFGAAMAWRLQHYGQVLSLAYLPWLLLFLERVIARGSLLGGLLAGFFAALIVLGRDQVALLAIYVAAGYTLWRLASDDAPARATRRALLPLVGGGLVALALVAFPILMTALLATESNRPSIDYLGAGRGSLHPALLLTLLAPDIFGAAGSDYWGPPSFVWLNTGLYTAQNVGILYVGAVPLLLVLTGLLRGELWSREIRFFTVAFVLVLLYALGWYTPAFRVMYAFLPGVDLYRRPADAVFLIGAMLAVLAGYATHRLFAAPWLAPGRVPTALVALLLAAALGAALSFGWRLDRLPRLAQPVAIAAAIFAVAAMLIAWARSRLALQPTLAGLVLAGFTAADLGLNNGNNGSSALPPALYEVLDPASRNETTTWLKAHIRKDATYRDRVELVGIGFHWPNASIPHRLENTLGYNPVRLNLYTRATGAEDHAALPDQRKFAPLMPSYRAPLADLLGLRYIAAGAPIETIDKLIAPDTFPLVKRTADAWVHENRSALPRVLFATRAVAADFDAMLRDGGWPDVDFRTSVLIEGAAPDDTARRPGTAALVSYANTRIVIDAESPDGGYVVLNDTWHPWWAVEIDGRPASLLRANVLVRAVAVPPGRHRVTFTFRPIEGALRALRFR